MSPNLNVMMVDERPDLKRVKSMRMFYFVSTFLGLSLLAACSSPPENPSNICLIFDEKRSWYKASKKAEKRWGTPIHVQLAFINVESSFESDARPRRKRFLWLIPTVRPTSAYGYSQAVDRTWATYQRESGNGGADRDSFKDSADFVAWYIRENSRRLGIEQSDAYRQYLAYHEGPAGYRRGSYQGKKKRHVRAAAQRTQNISNSYARQLAGCRRKLD